MKPYYPPPLCTGIDALEATDDPDGVDWDYLVDCYVEAVADTELVKHLRQTGRSPDNLIDGHLAKQSGWPELWYMAFTAWLLFGRAPTRTLDVYMGAAA